jgi:hypothetical protein
MVTALQSIKDKILADRANIKSRIPAPSGRNISVAGKTFKLPNGQSTPGPLEAVILGFRNFNRYYTAAYNPSQLSPPACYAIGDDLETMAPDPAMAAKAGTGPNCKGCTMNAWKSAPNGKGKACRNTVRVALMTPDSTLEDEPYIIGVSPTGLKSWGSFISNLEAAELHTVEMVAEIAFDPNQTWPSLTFKPIRTFDNLELAWVLRERAQALLDAEPSAGD